MTENILGPTTVETERWRWLCSAQIKESKHRKLRHISAHSLLLQHFDTEGLSYPAISAHSLLLQLDIEKAFCAGAWLSVIVLSQAAIEATIRQIETNDYKTNAKDIFGDEAELQQIRALRNEIVHPGKPDTPSVLWSVPNGDLAACHAAQEEQAKLAVKLVYRSIYVT